MGVSTTESEVEDSIIYRISIVYLSYMYRVCIVTISGIMAEKAGYYSN